MGEIVRLERQQKTFAPKGMAQASKEPAQNDAGGPGRVLLFTGVRYERSARSRKGCAQVENAAIKAAGKSLKNG